MPTFSAKRDSPGGRILGRRAETDKVKRVSPGATPLSESGCKVVISGTLSPIAISRTHMCALGYHRPPWDSKSVSRHL